MNRPDSRALPDNILLIDKPKGITSFDVIRQLRKKLGIKKMGHAGTLDPLASGLMIVGVQKGTKLLNHYIGLPKEYKAKILIGKSTTTGDLEGSTVEEKDVHKLPINEVQRVVDNLHGTHILPVPIYSAVKVSGTPLYKRARRGEQNLQPPLKKMTVHSISLNGHERKNNHLLLDITVTVSSGTYIRSIAEEIGRELDLPATLYELQRTKIGPYDISDAEKM